MSTIKVQLQAILDEIPHTLSVAFKEQIINLLGVTSLDNMQGGLRSMLRLFTFVDVPSTKQSIIYCLQLIQEFKRSTS